MKKIKFRVFEIIYLILTAQSLGYLAMITLIAFLQPAWNCLNNSPDIFTLLASSFAVISQTVGCIWLGCFLLLKLPARYHEAVFKYTYATTSIELSSMPVLSVVNLTIPVFILAFGAIFSEIFPSQRDTIPVLCFYLAQATCAIGIVAIILMSIAIWFMKRYRRCSD